MKLNIMGDKWKIIILSKKVFKKKYKRCVGITIPKKHKIVIRKKNLTYDVVIHELVHAYFSYQCMMSVEISHNIADEFYADFWADYGPKIIKQSKVIVDYFKK